MQLYNSLTHKKETFQTLIPNQAKMYVCGITPYDTTHVGHAFVYTFFDTLQSYLTYQGYHVTYVQNVTDIDDDILRKARENAAKTDAHLTDWRTLGQFWTDKFLTDLKALDIQMPTHYVKATETIPTIIEITQTLLEKGFAYEKEGTVFFRVAKDPEYGKLSRFTPQQMKLLSKERGANPDDPRKENPLDFILWQKSEQGEPVWDPHQTTDKTSIPPGRPGWHIECTAMNYQYLGPQIDIHGGGHDLIYPHHESEIAQMEAFTGQKPFTRFWIHIGMVGYMGEKMSKSLGNLIMVSDLLKKYSPQAIRYLLLSHHYRTAWEFNEAELEQAEEKVKEIHTALPQNATKSITPKKEKQSPIQTEFNAAMDDDCNTPQALQVISDLTNKINNTPTQQKEELQSILKDLTTILRI